jgi:two-component system phosphate regulon response regulator PhoB
MNDPTGQREAPAMAQPRGAREGAGEAARPGRRHVFVVNGAPVYLELMRELLRDADYAVTTTTWVPATFDQVAALAPSLLVVDLEVGRRAGWDMLQRLHEGAATRGIPVVVVSSDPRLLAEAEAQRARYGGQGWVAKPFDIDDLLRTIRGLLGPA